MNTPGKFKTFLFFFPLLFNYNLLAQSSFNIGIDLSAGVKGFPPNGKLGNGLSAEYEKSVSGNGSIRLYFGYDRFEQRFPRIDRRTVADSITNLGLNGYDFASLPIRIGYQHTLFKNGPFAYAEAGVSHVFTRSRYPPPSKNIFSYSVGTGYKLNQTNHTYLQFSTYYNCNQLTEIHRRNYISFRAAYGLTFSRAKKQLNAGQPG